MSVLELPIPQIPPPLNPLKVVVVRRNTTSNDGNALVRWCHFHHIYPSMVDHQQLIFVKGRVLIMTDDLLPSEQVPLSIVKELQVCSTVEYRTDAEGRWNPSFILLCNFEDGESGTPSQLLHVALDTGLVVHRPSLVAPASEGEVSELNLAMSKPQSEESRYEILCMVLVRYWYDLDHLVVARYYSHAWLHAYQRLACTSIDIDGIPTSRWRDGYDWVRQQSPFASSYSLKEVEGNLTWAISACIYSRVPLGSRLEGIQVRVKEHISRLHRHPLTLPGLVRVVSDVEDHGYDTSITMVGYYYNLGYASKPRDEYLKSFDKYVTIRHPLIFYGDIESCSYIQEKRDPLFTKVIAHPVEEWPPISNNLELFNDTSSAHQMAKSPRYALLTNCKTYAVMDAISINPFNSSHFVWHDPGFYRHGYMASGLPLSYPLFSRLPMLKGRITMPSLTTSASITDEQYNNAGETLIAYIMGGDAEAWKKFHSECETFLQSKLAQSKLYTEQCIHTRIATLRPDLFNLSFSNYAPFNVNRFLGLEVNYEGYLPSQCSGEGRNPKNGKEHETPSTSEERTSGETGQTENEVKSIEVSNFQSHSSMTELHQ